MSHYQTPILFLIFNRPDLTKMVFEEIRKQKPKYLFIAADGPRAYKTGEDLKCATTIKLVTENIDWDCELNTLFRDQNLGCGKAVSEAITWFFEHVEEGVIIEDDCLPNKSFFTFCSEMLDRYRTNDRIMHVSGNNFQNGIWRGEGSYYFSQFPHIWGWATWKRAWQGYDISLSNLPAFVDNKIIYKIIKDKKRAEFWLHIFKEGFTKKIDTWDYAWFFNFFYKNGYAILPNRNLVSNIGFREDATHTKYSDKKTENLQTFLLKDIVHPSIKLDSEADHFSYYNLFHNPETRKNRMFKRIKSRAKAAINQTVKSLISNTGYQIHIKKANKTKSILEKNFIGRYNISYPQNHNLKNILNQFPDYSQNIARLCQIMEIKYKQLHLIDVGANIGDTALIARNSSECLILCIEGHEEYYEFLKLNTKNIGGIETSNTYLDETDNSKFIKANKNAGTLSLVSEKDGTVTNFLKLDTLLNQFPNFKNSKILKVDTDGYDINVLKGSTEYISQVHPVIYFEYDVNFYSTTEFLIQFIDSLAEVGYTKIIIYDNYGRFIMQLNIPDRTTLFYLTEYIRNNKILCYYDFCVFHTEDIDVCEKLIKTELSGKCHEKELANKNIK